ncbi:hypothetical protein [Coleofasciculus chthonoplastes]|nr:hypothetical protein [Coleofasciculus chthonoplastes]
MSVNGFNYGLEFLLFLRNVSKMRWHYRRIFIGTVGFWILSVGRLQAISQAAFNQVDSMPFSDNLVELDKTLAEKSVTPKSGIKENLSLHRTHDSPPIYKSAISPSLEPIPYPSPPEVTLNFALASSPEIPTQTDSCLTEVSSTELHYPSDQSPLLIAAPENFNPGLRLPPESPELPSQPSSASSSTEWIVLEGLTTDFRYDHDNFDQRNLFVEETAQFRLRNGNIVRFKTGLNSFEHPDVDSVTNIPIQVGWEGKIDQVTVEVAGGVDWFDRLPTALNLSARVEAPIAAKVSPTGELESGIFPAFIVEQAPYKFNAETLDNQITAWRFGPNLYWQIAPDTSFFTFLRVGLYNDGNQEWQSFSRLEQKMGQFYLAANLFTWSYQEDLETQNGYFSPPDFLVYNAEIGWEGDIFEFLSCRLAATLGRQRLDGEFDNANGYEARCTAKISPNVEADFGYRYTNVQNRATGDSDYNNDAFSGQVRISF